MYVIHDNIATPGAPVWRARITTPLTPRAVREQVLATSQDVPAAERQQWLNRRRSPLDKMLTEEEADALERWARNEELMNGRARTADYTGDRVQTSPSNIAPIHDNDLDGLHAHSALRKTFPPRSLELLTVFTRQMARDREAMSPAEAGFYFFPGSKNKRVAYFAELQRLAERMVSSRY